MVRMGVDRNRVARADMRTRTLLGVSPMVVVGLVCLQLVVVDRTIDIVGNPCPSHIRWI